MTGPVSMRGTDMGRACVQLLVEGVVYCEYGLYPYYYTPVQVPLRRLDFCRFMLNANLEDPAFLRNIL